VTFGSLFSGIGGIDLGLERAGMQCLWQVEIDPFCQNVLAKHWPDVKRYGDITKLDGSELERVDLIAGGFPCQDVSHAGTKKGLDGARSGLWFEMSRMVRVVRPRYVVVENVAALLVRGLGRVLGDLAALGYSAEWECLPAAAFGAPHIRDRVFILAYDDGDYSRTSGTRQDQAGSARLPIGSRESNAIVSTMANTESISERAGLCSRESRRQWRGRLGDGGSAFDAPDSNSQSEIWPSESWSQRGHWATEPDVGRVANGIPRRVDRLRGLGNAVVPQVAEWIGRRIIAFASAAENVSNGVAINC